MFDRAGRLWALLRSPSLAKRWRRRVIGPAVAPSRVRDLLASEVLFVISPGRSGTKSLVDFCSRYTDMLCVHAPRPWVASIGYLYHLNEISPEAAKFAFYATREPYLMRAFQRKQVFFDGDCKNLPLTLEVADLMPKAKFIHLVRRPESFIQSGLARGYYRTVAPELWGHLTASSVDRDPEILLRSQIEKIAYFWNEANRIAELARSELGASRVVTLIAEEMFNNPFLIVNALVQLGLGHVVHSRSRYTIRRLNEQKKNRDAPTETIELIERLVHGICGTRGLYYD